MKMDVNSVANLIDKLDDVSSVDCTNSVLSLVVDASDALKKFAAFTKYWSDLYGTGLQVSGWHLNGALEDFDNFYDSAMECFDLGRSFTAFLYESNGIVTEDFATYDTAFEAIAMAKARGWDEVVDDTTGEVVYRK